MKKQIVYILIGLIALCGQVYSQQHVSIHVQKQPAMEVFREIQKQSGMTIYCNPADVDSLSVTLDCTNLPAVEAILQAVKEPQLQVFQFSDKYLFILKDKKLITALPDDFFEKVEIEKEYSNFAEILSKQKEQKATSENKIYTIGDVSSGSSGKIKLSGHMTDFRSGEPIVGAVVYIEKPSIAATTDGFGFYTLLLPAGRHNLQIKGMGLKDTQRQIILNSEGKLDIELEEQVYSLKEVTITSDRIANVKSNTLGVERLTIKEVKNIPTVFGEKDVLRIVMMLPGVKAVGEASSGFNVRGGATDQNLILFNDGTVYNPTHLFGLFSAFNADVVKDIELYKSSIPAKYGGRISSVLDINGREGNKKKFTGSASIGLLTSQLVLEGPIGKKTSFIAGGRTTYSDWLLNLLPEKSGYKDGKAGFYDMNLIVDHKFSDKDNLYVSGYYSHDRFQFDTNERYNYTNANGSVKWRHVYQKRLTSTFTGGYDHYDYQSQTTENPAEAYLLRFDINQMFGKLDFTHYLNEAHTLDFGIGSTYYMLNPGKFTPNHPESLVNPDKLQQENAVESYVYLADRWEINERLSINAGIRYMMFNAMGPRTYSLYDPSSLPTEGMATGTEEISGWKAFKTYHAPEFRLSARYAFDGDFSVKAGFNTLQQNIHKLSNTTIMSPTDTWKLSDANIKPQKGMQVAAGLYKNFLGNTIETSVEGYYKTMKNYLDYRSGAQLTMNHHIETDVISTQGKAYGVELMLKKTQGKLNGWLSYSYSRTLLRQNDKRIKDPINNGDWYAADYDKPHEIKFAGNYKFTQRYSFSLNCDYSTGRPVTLPAAKYDYAGGEFVYYSGRNEYRIPDFFRMDVAFNIEPSHKLTLLTHSTVSIGVYNVTGRKNAYSVYYISEEGVLKGYKMAIFGAPIPYISYNIKF